MKNNKSLRTEWFKEYLNVAPVSLALVRANECQILSKLEFKEPILDIGCGDGIFASVFFEKQIDEGIDMSPDQIARAKKRKAYKNLRLANAAKLPYKDKPFMTVFSNCVFEHIPQIDDVLKEVSRVLNVKGKLIFTVPSEAYGTNLLFSSLFRKIGLIKLADLYARKVNFFCRHYNLHNLDVWKNKLEKAGLKLESCQVYLSPTATKAHDIMLIFGLFSMINKRLFGRMILFPKFRKFIVSSFVFPIFNPIYRIEPKNGSSLLIIAKKE